MMRLGFRIFLCFNATLCLLKGVAKHDTYYVSLAVVNLVCADGLQGDS